jgi:hypothetical protein
MATGVGLVLPELVIQSLGADLKDPGRLLARAAALQRLFDQAALDFSERLAYMDRNEHFRVVANAGRNVVNFDLALVEHVVLLALGMSAGLWRIRA